jgi:diguanylate cyclase (GGDEF)-like protein
LYERLDSELARAQRYGHPLAAMMLDLDHLKAINDQFGHEVGNEAIRRVARHLQSQLREVDFAARYGGDEFAVLVPHQTEGEASVLAERLRVSLAQSALETPKGLHTLTMSVGIAAYRNGFVHDNAAALLDSADAALYQAKRQGRNRVCVARPDNFAPRHRAP